MDTRILLAEQDTAQAASTESELLHPIGRVYREKVGQLTAVFQDDALKAKAFERLRALIEAVVLTPAAGDLTIDLRGELASMLELCASTETRNAPEAVASGRCKSRWLRGQDLNL